MNLSKCLSVALIACLPFFSAAQVTWLNPQPASTTCSQIAFTDPLHGYIINTNGELITTVDGGSQWTVTSSPGALAISIDRSSGTGIITTYSGALLTTDNGLNWSSLNGVAPGFMSFADVVSRDTMFVANTTGDLYRSDDRGLSWKKFSIARNILSFEFINSKLGFAGGYSENLWATVDGGVSWQSQLSVNTIPSGITAIKFCNTSTGYMYRERAGMMTTHDGGQTWKTVSTNSDDIISLFALDDNTAIAGGHDGVIYITRDGGNSWKYSGPDAARIADHDIKGIWLNDASTAFACGIQGRILKSTDGTATWKQYALTYLDITDLSFPTPSVGYASVYTKLFKTVDGGLHWDTAYQNNAYNVFAKIHFFNKDTGVAAMNGAARVFKTYDGGIHWRKTDSLSQVGDAVSDMQFVNDSLGFIVLNDYNSGALLKTRDGGETWTPTKAKYYSQIFSRAFFLSETEGYASVYGTVYKTTDGGATWNMVLGNNDYFITSIFFLDKKTGWVAGDYGFIRKTTDSGKTWLTINVPAGSFAGTVQSLRFIDENVGVIGDEYGGVLKTVDGGFSWQPLGRAGLGYEGFPILRIGADSSVYMAGKFGAIMKANKFCELNAPTVITPFSICKNETPGPLTASGGDAYLWYKTATGAVPGSYTAPTPAYAGKDTVSYWVANAMAGGCISERKRIDVIFTDGSAGISDQNNTQNYTVTGTTSFSQGCKGLSVSVAPNGVNPVNSSTTAKLWIEPAAFSGYAARHFEITPQNNPATATARITLYFTQAEFNDFNQVNPSRLPVDSSDFAGIARVKIEKRSGTSSDGTGLPGSYSGTVIGIDPDDNAVVWNSAQKRWEISFDVTGFSGFFLTTISAALPVGWLSLRGEIGNNSRALLYWKVQETGVQHYTNQRSADAIRFKDGAQVNSLGDGVHEYQLTDELPVYSALYYRIQKTDRDGKVDYSNILKLDATANSKIMLYPNPSTAIVYVVVSAPMQYSMVNITDLSGHLIKRVRLHGTVNQIDAGDLYPGSYFVKFEDGTVMKLIKQ